MKTGREKSEEDHQHSPLIWDRASMVNRMMGDEEMVEIIIRGFLADMPRQIESLRVYLEAGDVEGVERQVHTIKGASANVGGEALRALATELEQTGKAGDLESVKSRLDELDAGFEELNQTILRQQM